MQTRVLTAVGSVLLLTLAACGASPQPATDPPSLPDPTPTGATAAYQFTGTGAKPMDLSGRVGDAKTVSVHWFCLGGSDLQLTAGGKTLVGAGCARSTSELAQYGGDIPLSLASTLDWQVQTGPDTRWRLAVTLG